MPTFKNEPEVLRQTINEVLKAHPCYEPLLERNVKIDAIFAYANQDENNKPIGNAITVNGVKALGKCKVVSLKDRAKGHGDAEIIIDGDHWDQVGIGEQFALVDHELYHIVLNQTKTGVVRLDDLGRPKLRIRKHDYQFGWFTEIARRNGAFSGEQLQARQIFEEAGQFYWPAITQALGINADVEQTAKAIRRS